MVEMCSRRNCKREAQYLAIYTAPITPYVQTVYVCNRHLKGLVVDAFLYYDATYIGVYKI